MHSDNQHDASLPAPPARGERRGVLRRRLLTATGAMAAALALGPPPPAGVARWLIGADSGRPGPAAAVAHGDGEADRAPATAAVRAASPGAWATPDVPAFADVARVDADGALLFLAGRDPRYPGANLDSLMGFSPAVILETMDTDVLDTVYARRGWDAVVALYRMIAAHTLDSLLAVYGSAPVVLALDAGHGGKRGVYYDPGSNGTEADHARRVVGFLEDLAAEPPYTAVTVRRIFNDDLGDDFGLPPPNDRKGAAALTIRNARASMLAYEAARWNESHPDAPVAVHVVSVHCNAGSGGTLVLHQGDDVPAPFRDLSVAQARAYVDRVRPALNGTGLLPYTLRLALRTGLSDDRLLYEPPVRFPTPINPYTGVDRSKFPRRYAMLQASLLQRDYADGALRYRGLT